MSDTMTEEQADLKSYPTTGVRIGINYHDQTLGKHRPRFSLDREVVDVLRRGLSYPRVHIDGDFVNGLRLWCSEEDGMTPTISNAGTWALSVPCRRVRAREDHVTTMDVPFEWERDETGPVIVIPRLPDVMLPEAVIDKLPNSQVDMSTIMDRAEKRLMREMNKVFHGEPVISEDEPEVPEVPEDAEPEPMGEPTPNANLEAIANAPDGHEIDLKEALGMVNEIVDRLGDRVALSIDENGHVRAKRRIVTFIDL
jgi:hypothetical protein